MNEIAKIRSLDNKRQNYLKHERQVELHIIVQKFMCKREGIKFIDTEELKTLVMAIFNGFLMIIYFYQRKQAIEFWGIWLKNARGI